ncbi:MAG: hypothetical protein SV062_14730 [Thermodesulfobacteriota bacterium]|nr:hypothetical protein [Thermodesulfobacteriota bacterium]
MESINVFMKRFLIIPVLLLYLLYGNILHGDVYEVGSGKTYSRIIDCPTHNLKAGDIIKVYSKSTPYYEKFLLYGAGTADNPIILQGIPDEEGNKPIIDGKNAVSSTAVDYWNEDRQIIKIGQFENYLSDHIIIDGFVIRNANNTHSFVDDSGNTKIYSQKACAVRPEYADNVTLKNCEVYNNGIGIQNGHGNPQNMTVEKCNIYNNGSGVSSSEYCHNLYFAAGGEGSKVTVQFCRVGDLVGDGQQFKSRVETAVIRYNWIEGGKNSQLDLVDNDDNGVSDAYVYGNVIIKPADTDNNRMIHFGGDGGGGDIPRAGTLYFFNNTCIINAVASAGRIFEISSPDANIVADNNIFYKNTGTPITVWRTNQNIRGNYNWLSDTITEVDVFTNNIIGEFPGFFDFDNKDFHLKDTSVCIDVVTDYTFPLNHNLEYQYVKELSFESRIITNNALDLGAFEYNENNITVWETAYNKLFKSRNDLKLLRQYRDKVLSVIKNGKMYTTLLYNSSEKALKILLGDPELMFQAKYLIYVNMDAVSEVIKGNDGVVYNTSKVASFLDEYAKKSPQPLKDLANMVKKEMLKSKMQNKTFLGFILR